MALQLRHVIVICLVLALDFFQIPVHTKTISKIDQAKKVYAIISELVGFPSGIMGLYDSISDKLEDDHAEIMAGFSEVKEKLSSLEKDIEETKKAVHEEGIKTRFFPCEMGVKNSLRSLNQYLSDGQTDYLKNKFLRDAKQLENNINCLISGLLADSENSGSVLLTARDSVQCHAKKLKRIIDSWMVLINTGIYVHSAYVGVAGITKRENQGVRRKIKEDYKKIYKRTQTEIKNCLYDESLIDGEIRNQLAEHQHLNHEDMARLLFDFLDEKYYAKQWFVMVYNDIGGFDRHKLDGDFHVLFRERGRNVAVYSTLVGSRIDDSKRTIMENFKPRKEVYKKFSRYLGAYDAEKPWAASYVYDDLRTQLGDDVGIAVVERLVGLKMYYNTDSSIKNYDPFTVIGLPVSARRIDPNSVEYPDELTLSSSSEIFGEGSRRIQSSGESSSGERLSGESSSGESPSGESPSGESSSGESPSGESSSGERPSGESSSGERPSGESSSGESPSGESSSGERPSEESSSGERPSGESSSGESPSGESSSGERPSGESSSGERPSEESSSGERGSTNDSSDYSKEAVSYDSSSEESSSNDNDISDEDSSSSDYD